MPVSLQQRLGFSAHAIVIIKNDYITNLVETRVQDCLADGVRSGDKRLVAEAHFQIC